MPLRFIDLKASLDMANAFLVRAEHIEGRPLTVMCLQHRLGVA